MALTHSEESPASVRQVAQALADYIGRLGEIWIEGQLSEVRVRPGASVVFMRLRDVQADVSLSLVASSRLFETLEPRPEEGARIVVLGRIEMWSKRGDLHLRARTIRAVGLGELLARLEQLRALLEAEGVFDAARKRPLPFVPRRVGLICGRNSEAERDVTVNAAARWPGVQFEIREVTVQGVSAAAAVTEALLELDELSEVDVIIITRGGGSVEDLLPFSEESLVRAVSAARTPVVSAIGHERDRPLLDDVADVRASTPTDAARRVVPDLAEESDRLARQRARLLDLVRAHWQRHSQELMMLRNNPALARPAQLVEREGDRIRLLRIQTNTVLSERLTRASESVGGLRHRLHALSPAATLERGYAVVHNDAGVIAFGPEDIAPHSDFTVRLADGQLRARRISDSISPEPEEERP